MLGARYLYIKKNVEKVWGACYMLGARYLYMKKNVEKVWGACYMLGARYLYIKKNVEKVWGACYMLGARCLSKNTVITVYFTVTNKNVLTKRNESHCANHLNLRSLGIYIYTA
jgi:gamma-glutamylcyclotransferase (GGCT)/AIG2-like uncharacterized protein YtfP